MWKRVLLTLALALSAATASAAAVAVVQATNMSAACNCADFPATTAFGTAVTSGNLLVVGVTQAGGACVISAPTDSGGNTYVQMGTQQAGIWNSSIILSVWYAKNVTGGAAFTVTGHCASGASTWESVVAVEVSGASTTAPYNNDFAKGADSSTMASSVTSTPAPAANSLGFGAISSNCANNGIVEGASFTHVANEQQGSNNNQDLYIEHLSSVTSAAFAANWTSGSCSHIYVAFSFKPAASRSSWFWFFGALVDEADRIAAVWLSRPLGLA